MIVIAERAPLGQLLLRPPRYGINAAAVPLTLGISTYIRITDIDESGRFAPHPKVGVAHTSAASYRLAPGELVFARTGASVGKSYLYNSRDGELVFAGFLINVAPDPTRLNPKYLALFAQTKEYWDWIARTSVRSGQPGVNGREFAQLLIPVPDVAVQDAIARVMTDVEDLIATLERLIVKKQAIKQGMMQELLAGRTRLPGFTEPWRRTDVGDLVEQHRTAVDPRSHLATLFQHFSLPAFDDSETPVLEVGASIDSQKMRVPVGAVLISKLNPRIPRIWVTSRVRENAIASTEFIVLTARQGVDRAYLGWLLKSAPIASRMKLLAVGTTGSHARIHPRQVQALECSVPKLKEQKAIASVLDDVATELDRLRTRLDKAKAIKQGMMQELLTGQTRLPIGGLVR
jgi:type I restriction enzyme S subunit